MTKRSRLWLVWGSAGVLLAGLLVPLWGPLGVAWRCYALHVGGTRAEGELLHKLEQNESLVLSLRGGPHPFTACTLEPPTALYEQAEVGQTFDVVYRAERPGECVLQSTIENSGLLLGSMTGVLVFTVLLILGGAAFLHRTFTRPEEPQRRMDVSPDAVRCPRCGKPMAEGYAVAMAVHWRNLGEPIGLPSVVTGLPGTVGWWERPRLHAFRCEACEIATFQYGKMPPGSRG